MLSILFESHIAGNLAETLSAEVNVVLADKSLLAATALAGLDLAGALCGVFARLGCL